MVRYSPLQQMIAKDEELEENKAKRRAFLRRLNKELIEEEKKTKALGTCPRCNMVLTTTGKCPMGC